MPTYEYVCAACNHRFEQYQSITAPPIRKCPSCGRQRVSRLIGTGAGVIFKGSGFYQTDYRSESYKKAAQAESGTDSKSDSKADSKVDSKTDSKAKPAADGQPASAAASEKKTPRPKGRGRSSNPPADT
jgi:putative FmdB family regulatory protein